MNGPSILLFSIVFTSILQSSVSGKTFSEDLKYIEVIDGRKLSFNPRLSDGGPRTGYDSSYVYIRARNEDSREEVTVCGNYQQFIETALPTNAESAPVHPLEWLRNAPENYDLCGGVGSKKYDNAIVPSWYRIHRNTTIGCPKKDILLANELTWQAESVEAVSGKKGALLFLVKRGQEYIVIQKVKQPIKDYLVTHPVFADFRDEMVNDSVIDVPMVYMYEEKFQSEILDMLGSQNVTMRIYRPHEYPMDAAMVIIWLIAVSAVAIGGLWGGHIRHNLLLEETADVEAKATNRGEGSENAAGNNAPSDNTEAVPGSSQRRRDKEPSATPFGWISMFFFVIVIAGMLLLLYFFYGIFVWFILVTYTIAGSIAIYSCLTALLNRCGCVQAKTRRTVAEMVGDIFCGLGLPCNCAKAHIKYRNLFIFIVSVSFCITWVVYRKWGYAFIMQDTISLFFSINLIRSLRLPNLKWITILLSALLFYDLFMVFITPYFTRNGCSIMVEVATGSSYCHSSSDSGQRSPYIFPPSSREQLPILIQVPRLRDPMLDCYDLSVDLQFPPMMLGLGDIILPGMLVGFCFAVDIILGNSCYIYGFVSTFAYGVGLIVTFVALMMSRKAQPALIYLVPFTLIATIVTAAIRRQLKLLWNGELRSVGKVVGETYSAMPTEDNDEPNNYNSIQ